MDTCGHCGHDKTWHDADGACTGRRCDCREFVAEHASHPDGIIDPTEPPYEAPPFNAPTPDLAETPPLGDLADITPGGGSSGGGGADGEF